MFKRLEIDLGKVNNIFALLAVFLLASEGLLGYWFSQAKDPWERIIAGLLMTIIFLCFLFLIFKLAKERTIGNAVPKALDEPLTAAREEVSVEQIKEISAEQISGPEGTYTIDAPPSNWKIKTVSLNGLFVENSEINDPNMINQIFGTNPNSRENILLLKSNSFVEIIPILGKTIINGTMIPTALITKSPLQLSIIPLERLQPPFFSEYSFEHNVFKYVGDILRIGVYKMQSQVSGNIKESGRDFIQVELIQELEHVDILIDEQTINDCSKVQINTNIIAIKGDIIDHLLVMNYPSIENKVIADLMKNELNTLKSLVSSFKPLKIKDPVKLINEIKENGKNSYEILLKENGINMFSVEFIFALKKIKELNPNNNDDKKKIIRILKPFKEYYKLLGQQDAQYDEFWTALDDAEKGDYQNLFELMDEFLKDLDEELNPPEIKNLTEGDQSGT